jgi:hypothetical protein
MITTSPGNSARQLIPKLNLAKAIPIQTFSTSPERWSQLVLTSLPLAVCGVTLLGYYPFEETIDIDLDETKYSETNLPTLVFLTGFSLLLFPSLKVFTSCSISQQMLIAVCLQMLAVFSKVFQFVPQVH